MTPRAIAFSVLSMFWTAVMVMLWRTFVAPRLRRRVRVVTPAPEIAAVKLPPPWQAVSPRHPKTGEVIQLPPIPSYLTDAYVFLDARLGVAMLANMPVIRGKPGESWLFRVHGDHWCTVRAAGWNDIETVDKLKSYQPSLAS
jgi:hypothetical protein